MMYASSPDPPPNTVSSTVITRTHTTSHAYALARPWHTPAIILPIRGLTSRVTVVVG
jgi:hypothetical protein